MSSTMQQMTVIGAEVVAAHDCLTKFINLLLESAGDYAGDLADRFTEHSKRHAELLLELKAAVIRNTNDLRKMPYGEYLKSDWWAGLRERALKAADHKCSLCNSTERLEVHHRTYERRGCEFIEDLIVLCRLCHSKFHGKLPTG